ncbi:ABC transporter ATP-binding protein [Neorhizobium sp. BT27B]|uniref:ABC transporter ATP-binding protein n=1 Tax=Neorhizobium sp. BT27B TaxID=3142625 RepID=UPI003D2713BF
MSSDVAIDISGLSKRFEIYEHPRDQLKQFLIPRLRRAVGAGVRDYFREFWALKNINLQIRKGESCGIVGLNGSGKSTLLQIITGTLHPTHGRVEVNGRVAALLELGSGFNLEFTGRENVYIYGAVMGFNKRQVDARIEDIEAFADIGSYMDQPLKSYSSGMQMRVAFSVATAFSPDILIVDEALAVGDAYFQQKCFHRIEQFKKAGGTLLFVSHDANTVKQLCDKAVLLSHGDLLSEGSPRTVIDLYQGLIAKMTDFGDRKVEVKQREEDIAQAEEQTSTWSKATTITTDNNVELIDFWLRNDADEEVIHLHSEEELVVGYRVRFKEAFDRPAFGLIVRDKLGRSIFETSTYAMRMAIDPIGEEQVATVRFTFKFNLRAGQYSFSVGVANRGFSRSEFEQMSLLMHDVQQLQVLDCPTAAFYGGIYNMNPGVDVMIEGKHHV